MRKRQTVVPVANLIWVGSGSRIGRCCCVMRDLCRLIGWMVVDPVASNALGRDLGTPAANKRSAADCSEETILLRHRPIDIR